jgi:drug/metabolite transporter (DMT)-like permease
MPLLLNSPGLLLLATGALLGLTFPLGKLASQAGVPGPLWAAWISLSVSLVLGLLLWVRREAVSWNRSHRRYFVVTALVSYALPNLLLLAAIPRLGSGLTSLFFTLSPILTVALSGLAGLRQPKRLELAGIAVGLIGAVMVVSGRGEVGHPAAWAWLLAASAIPVSLAAGNVFRTVAWPAGSSPLWLAVGSNAASAAMLLALAAATCDVSDLARLAHQPGLMAAQATASSAMFLLFFRLQQVGGPVTLSQIGTVAAAVGVGVGAGVLGERYALAVWLGVAVIAAGLGLTLAERLRATPQGDAESASPGVT